MRKSLYIIYASALSLLMALEVNAEQVDSPSKNHFGGTMPESGQIVPLREAIANLDSSSDKLQKVSGTVTQVCRKKGCWMILSDKGTHARITFKDYKFFVPTDTGRQQSVVYGILTEKNLSEKMAKHYAKDEGKSSADIKGPRKEYSIVANAVLIEE